MNQLVSVVESSVTTRVREAIAQAVGLPLRRGPGRPPANGGFPTLAIAGKVKLRKKAPKQLCPVPGCKNAAAPVFGMVCAKHKDVPKAKINQYREARRKAKEKKAA